tara:strand:- start:413 stop:2866 length:2454 start_codon:yes stop_codon:yes gene_type:complete
MQIYTSNNSSFPDQVVPDAEKQTWEYGLKVAKAIEGEWFSNEMNNGYRFDSTYTNFHNLRLYARGEQSVQKYKDELSIDGDLSYLNLDWKPVPVLAKFVDIVVNGMSQRSYEVKTMAQDPESVKKRTAYAQRIIEDIQLKQFDEQVQEQFGIDLSQSKKDENAPQTIEELPAHMQLNYKQSIEIAEEELINQVLDKNKYHLIRKRLNYDLAVLGIAATKTTFNRSNGIVTDYVDPARIVYSYTEDPNFEDIYYVGEIKNLSLVEIKKQFPYLTAEELIKMQQYQGNKNYARNWNGRTNDQSIQVLFFEWKTYANQVWKIKETPTGLEKALEKGDTFNPPETENFKKAFRAIEVLYSGAKVLGYENMLEWKLAENMTKPFGDTVKVNMSYNICAPRMYRGRIESIVSRTTGFADMINITSLKLQQVISRMVPDGVYLDVDGLAEVDLGNGTNYNPREALNMYFQTGSVVGRSLTQDGEMNRGKVPIQELQSSSGGAKIQALISTYQYYLQMIRDVTGLNEARDASTPDKNALVGLQKLAAANSNTATRHILQASLYLTLKTCENIALRATDALMFPLTRMALQNSVSTFNVATLDEIKDANLHDFGIFIELEPDDEEKAQLEQNIQVALQTQSIDLEDAIDIRNISNLKLANELLKKRRKQKQAKDQQMQQANIQAQAQANQETAEKAAMYEVQKQQAIAETSLQIEKGKSDFQIQQMQVDGQIKKELMAQQFGYDQQLKTMDLRQISTKEKDIEDRKDERTRIQATQQSKLIDQRKNDLLPTDFETNTTPNLGGAEQPLPAPEGMMGGQDQVQLQPE